MIKTKRRGNLIIISGTTCAGKGTVIKKLLEKHDTMELSISYTSRPMREGDIEDVTYHFVTKEEFEEMIKQNAFLEYEKVHYGQYYGTPKMEIEEKLENGKDVILEIDVKGAQNVKSMFPETILIFIMAPSMEIVKERIKERGAENPEQILKRFEVAYREINEVNKYNYVVVNDDLNVAIQKVEAILLSEKCRVDRIEEIFVENKEEIIHEFLMQKEFDNKIKRID
ncbi:MAG: guanylate kinase [Bacilli bacterium]|nr:guanylate kinase [Bacilli bacterium]